MIKGFLNYQTSPYYALIEYRWVLKEKALYINSEAGNIRFKPKTHIELSRFRDSYINRLEDLRARQSEGREYKKELFALYDEINRKEKVRYKGTLNVRWQRLKHSVF